MSIRQEAELFHKLARHFEPDRILNHAAIIFENDRWSTFKGYRKTADYLYENFRKFGADKVERIAIPFNGKHQFGDWITPLAWDAEEGVLELIDAGGISQQILADYRAVPNNLIRWSRGTAAGGEKLELIYLPDAKDEGAWEKNAARGKMVFTHSAPDHLVYALAVKHGAEGIVTDFSTAPVEYSKEVHWWNSWSEHYLWGVIGRDTPILGFVLSPETGKNLKDRILGSKKPLKVRATVKAALYKGSNDIVTATIEGAKHPNQEVVFYAHVYECQIDDNAVSAGMFLETVRIIKELMRQGSLPRPERTIRFVLGWEWFGSLFYAMHHKKGKQWLASSCSDGVATRQALTHQPLRLYLSPGFATSFADALFVDLWKRYFAANMPMTAWMTSAWVCGTDTHWIDPQGANVSNAWPFQMVGPTWHKSHSSLAMIDPEVLKYSGLTGMLWALKIAGANQDDAVRMMKIGADRAERELRSYARNFNFDRPDVSVARKKFEFEMNCLREKSLRMMDVSALVSDRKAYRKVCDSAVSNIDRIILEEKESAGARFRKADESARAWETERPVDYMRDREERVADNIVPHRLIKGSLWTLEKFSAAERKAFTRLGSGVVEYAYYLALADGRRSLFDIVRWYEFEYGKDVNIRNLTRSFEMLNKAGYVRLAYRKTYSESDLLSGLKGLGIRRGDTVLVHSSLFSFGAMQKGPETFFTALEKAVGGNGTVVFPSFAYNTTRDYPDAPYDAASTPARIGDLPELFWKRPGVLRSCHPSHGLAAKGAHAAWIIADNLPYSPYDIRGAFGKLYELDAKILMAGCGLAANSTMHVIEDWTGLPSMMPDSYHYMNNGSKREIRYEKQPFYHRDFYTSRLSSYERLLREKGLLREGFVGLARSFLMKTRDVIDSGIERARKGDFSSLYCSDPGCEPCLQARKSVLDKWRFPKDLPGKMAELKRSMQGQN